MAKFLNLNASTTGRVLVGLEGVATITATATTVVITYASGNAASDVVTITHTSDATFATRDAIYQAIFLAKEFKSNPDSFVTPNLPAGITISTVAAA